MILTLLTLASIPFDPPFGQVDFVADDKRAFVVGHPRAINVSGYVDMVSFAPDDQKVLLTGWTRVDLADAVAGRETTRRPQAWIWEEGRNPVSLAVQGGILLWDSVGQTVLGRRDEREGPMYFLHDAASGTVSRVPGVFSDRDKVAVDGQGQVVVAKARDGRLLLTVGNQKPVDLGTVGPNFLWPNFDWEQPTTLMIRLGFRGGVFRVNTVTLAVEQLPAGTEPNLAPKLQDWFTYFELDNQLRIMPEDYGEKKSFAITPLPEGSRYVALNGRADRLIFLLDGLPILRTLKEVPYERFDRLRMTPAREEAVSFAKQAMLGVIMYAGDNDMKFPPRGAAFQESIRDYVKNEDILKRFVFTLDAKFVTEGDVESPSETIAGYVEGPGGRAVAYTDGRVQWVPDK